MAARWSSLVVASEVYALDVVCGLLIVVVSCCRAWVLGHVGSVFVALRLQSTGSVIVAHRLSCPHGMWDLPRDQGSNLCLLHYQADS